MVGAASFWFAHRYLREQEQAVRQRVAVQYQTRDVIVAAANVPAGGILEPGSLARRAVPERFLASDAYAADLVGSVAGRRVQRALRSGEPVTASALELAGTPLLSALIEPGLRAVTIPVDESSAAAGLLAPGDLVDLLLVTRDATAPTGAAMVRPLLQAVRVVATGRQTRRAPASPGVDVSGAVPGGGETDSSYATLTLHVHPEDAVRILLAQRIGELAVVLRTAGDTAAGALPALDSDALLGGSLREQPHPRHRTVAIEYIIGGTSGAAQMARRSAARSPGRGEQP
jgi:pilus assembly protein CpaB